MFGVTPQGFSYRNPRLRQKSEKKENRSMPWDRVPRLFLLLKNIIKVIIIYVNLNDLKIEKFNDKKRKIYLDKR